MFLSSPKVIETRVFSTMPERLHRRRSGDKRPLNFIEGPSFDRAGNLYCVDIHCGRIYRISRSGEWEMVVEYDGVPNGLKIHKDGRVFVADRKNGVMVFDPETQKLSNLISGPDQNTKFLGLNDLVFAKNGDLYFTDQGRSGLQNANGRVYRLDGSGRLDVVLDHIPSPNGLVPNVRETEMFVAITRANAVWRVELEDPALRAGLFVQLPSSGPDGLAIDMDGNIAVAHPGPGTVAVYSKWGEPLWVVRSCAGTMTTNIAYGGPDGKTLFIVESWTNSILTAELPVAGKPMYSHA
jgi:gluconolactonase